MRPALLAVNAGSATLKFRVYSMDGAQALASGMIDRFGEAADSTLTLRDSHGAPLEQRTLSHSGKEAAVSSMLKTLGEHHMEIAAVVHRVVHGGGRFNQPTLITPQVRELLASYIPLAPLHQPVSLAVIDAFSALHGHVEHIACFDTAFHTTQPEISTRFGIARHWHDAGIRRYGFHGLSFASIARRLPTLGLENQRVVVCHLGSGSSACALINSRSVAASTGFSAVDGLMMSTRPGALDPEVPLYWLEHEGLSVQQVRNEMYKNSGLLGVSGISADMRVLLADASSEAREAVDLFCHLTVKEIGALAAVMQGLDAVIFTAGIGERSHEVRARILEQLAWLGFDLDHEANRSQQQRLTRDGSLRQAYMLQTDEEGEMAQSAAGLLARRA
jgi:acetate kinase